MDSIKWNHKVGLVVDIVLFYWIYPNTDLNVKVTI
jgi:hypothetical protein